MTILLNTLQDGECSPGELNSLLSEIEFFVAWNEERESRVVLNTGLMNYMHKLRQNSAACTDGNMTGQA